MQFDEVLRTFARFFEQERIRYAVIGGLALQAWGFSRFTRDIDLVVERNKQDRVVRFAESLGYETLHISEGYSNHLHPARGRIDFMYVDDTTAERLFGDAVQRPIVGDFTAPVPKPEHLQAMNRDLNDLFAGMKMTAGEAEALEAVRRLDHLDPVQYLDFLRQFAPRHPPSREIPPRHEPFVL